MNHRFVGAVVVCAVLASCGDPMDPGNGGNNNITLTLSPENAGLLATSGNSIQLTVTTSDGSSPAITWSSSNTSAATVSNTGRVTEALSVAPGSMQNVTITAAVGQATATMTVGIVPAATLSGEVQPIFTNNCAFSGCHAVGGGGPQQGQDLSDGNAFTNIVNVPAMQLNSMSRVTPGDQLQSYLVHKIRGTQADVGGSGSQMPRGAGPLSPENQNTIAAWVQAGADNN